jgi:hypothetical protein
MVAPVIAAAGALLPGLFSLIDDLFTSDDERAEAKRKLVEMEQKGRLAQLAVNAQEAQHESIFVAGWRPFVGWTCGLAFAWVFIARDALIVILAALAPEFDTASLPVPDLVTMMPVLLGMLGLGGMRTYEKRHGVNRNRGGITQVPSERRSAFR